MKDWMEKKKNKGKVKCQIFSRVVGYLRPTDQWNDAIAQSFNDRKVFKTNKVGNRVTN